MTGFRLEATRARELVALVAPPPADDASALRSYATIVWGCLVEPGDGEAGALVTELGAEQALRAVMTRSLDATTSDRCGVQGHDFRKALGRWLPRLDEDSVATAITTARRTGARLLVPGDPDWPTRLADLGTHAPVCLWVRGDPTCLADDEPALALVGARAASGYGEHVAGEFASDLVARGVSIVSGAAYGIDGAAHTGALGAGGSTIALLAGGVDRPYPAGHARLLARIAASGAVVSEVPCGFAPTRWRFLQRNRLIAALSDATVVVEAGWRSGSLNTAGHAATIGRPLGAVPGPITSAASAGCHRLLREFDARCVTSADEAAELLGLEAAERAGTGEGTAAVGGLPRTSDRTRVTDAMGTRGWRTVHDIARRSGMAQDEVAAQLGVLSLEGVVESDGQGWRRVASAPRR